MRFMNQIAALLICSLLSLSATAGLVNSYGGSWSANLEVDFPDVPTPANFTASYSGDFVNDVLLGGGVSPSLYERVVLNDFGDFTDEGVGVTLRGDVGASSVSFWSSDSIGGGIFSTLGQSGSVDYSYDWTFGVEDSPVEFSGSISTFPRRGADYQLWNLSLGTVVLEAASALSNTQRATLDSGYIYRLVAQNNRQVFGGGDGFPDDMSFFIENVDGFKVPDPASIGLLLAGIAAFGLRRVAA